jgi:hypothetical protein
MKIIKLLVCLGALWLAPNLPAQQITGSIRSTVTDPSGGAGVEGASVTVRQTETGLSRTHDQSRGRRDHPDRRHQPGIVVSEREVFGLRLYGCNFWF